MPISLNTKNREDCRILAILPIYLLIRLHQLGKQGQAALDFVQADAVAHPEIAGAAEAVAGDKQQIQCLGLLGKL